MNNSLPTLSYLAIARNYWGAGPTMESARKKLRTAGFSGRTGFIVLKLTPPQAEIQCHPLDGPLLPNDVTKEVVLDKRLKRDKP